MPLFLERLLRVLGPMQSEKFGWKLRADALNKIQKQVEVDYDKKKTSQKILFRFGRLIAGSFGIKFAAR